MRHGLGRRDCSSACSARRTAFSVGRMARGLALLGLAAAPLLLAGSIVCAQDDPRDLIELRRRDVRRERRVVDEDLNRERRLDDREYGAERRADPQALERRTKLYRDLKRDFIDFDKSGFDRGPDRRVHGIETSTIPASSPPLSTSTIPPLSSNSAPSTDTSRTGAGGR